MWKYRVQNLISAFNLFLYINFVFFYRYVRFLWFRYKNNFPFHGSKKKKKTRSTTNLLEINNFNNEFFRVEKYFSLRQSLPFRLARNLYPNWKIPREKEERKKERNGIKIFKDLAENRDRGKIRYVLDMYIRSRSVYRCGETISWTSTICIFATMEEEGIAAMEMQFSSPRSFGTTFT